VHISTKYTIMLSRTRLHVYICASLVMSVRSRCLPTIMTSSLHARHDVACAKNPSETVLHFCTFLLNPHFHLEPDYIASKPIKRHFQWYIVRAEIFSNFHARAEYNTSFCLFKPMGLSARTHTCTHTPVSLPHLADITRVDCLLPDCTVSHKWPL